MGYVSAGVLIRRRQDTLATLQRLERHHGHFYNWYDTRTLRPLLPLYASSVDSGNLAGHLLTLGSGLREQAPEHAPLVKLDQLNPAPTWREIAAWEPSLGPWQTETMLVSWSGSMFEHLMPLLVMPHHEHNKNEGRGRFGSGCAGTGNGPLRVRRDGPPVFSAHRSTG